MKCKNCKFRTINPHSFTSDVWQDRGFCSNLCAYDFIEKRLSSLEKKTKKVKR